MLNRFSSLPKANIRSSQSLVDLGVIDGALQRQQKIYDTQATQIASKVQEANQLDFLEGAPQQYKEKINQDLKNFVGEISTQDLADPSIRAKTGAYIQNLASDPMLQYHTNAKKKYDEFQKSYADLAAKGKLNDSQLFLRNLAWQKYKQTGEVPQEALMPLSERQNLVESRGELVKMIKPSGFDGVGWLEDIAYKTGQKGISPKTLDNAVGKQYLTYKMSPAGLQEKDDYDALVAKGAIDSSKLSFDQYLIGQIKSTTDNYAHMDYSSDIASAHGKKKEEKDKFTIPAETIGFSAKEGLDKYRFTSDGNFVADDMKSSWLGTAFDKVGLTNEATEDTMDDYQKEVVKIAKKNNISPKEVIDKHAQYTTVPFDLYGAGQGKELTGMLSAISPSAKINIGSKTTSLSDYAQEVRGINLKDSSEDGKKAVKDFYEGIQVAGEVRPAGKGGLVTGYVIGDPNDQVILDVTDQVLKKALNGDSKEQTKAVSTLNALASQNISRGLTGQMVIPDEKTGKMKQYKVYPNFNGGEPIFEEVK